MKPDYKKKSYAPQNRKQELKPLDEVKALFRDYFRKHNSLGHVMTKADVVNHILTKLDAKGEDAFKDALYELKDEGYVDVLEDGVSLVLTQMGVDSFSKKRR